VSVNNVVPLRPATGAAAPEGSFGRMAGDMMLQLKGLGKSLGRKRMIVGGAGIGGLLAAANEMGDKTETAPQNLVDALGAGVGGAGLAALAPLALGLTGPAGWVAAGLGGLAGASVGKAGLRGATDLIGLTRTETPEAKALRDAENAHALGIALRERSLPVTQKEMELTRQDQVERIKAELALRQQYEYAATAMNMASQNTASTVNSVPGMINQVMTAPTVFSR
jgi:hypothetical protein